MRSHESLDRDCPTLQDFVLDRLSRRWWTTADLARALGRPRRSIYQAIKAISLQRVIFCRRVRHLKRAPKAYRILPQARQVRVLPQLVK